MYTVDFKRSEGLDVIYLASVDIFHFAEEIFVECLLIYLVLLVQTVRLEKVSVLTTFAVS